MGMLSNFKASMLSMGVTIRHAREQKRRWGAEVSDLRAELAKLASEGAPIDEQGKVNDKLMAAAKTARQWGSSTSPSLLMAALAFPAGMTAALVALSAAFGPGFAFRELSFLAVPGGSYSAFAVFLGAAWLFSRLWDGAPKSTEASDLQFANFRRNGGLLLGAAIGFLAPAPFAVYKVVESLNPTGFYAETGFTRGSDGKASDLHVGLKYKTECKESADKMNQGPAGFAPGSYLARNFGTDPEDIAALSALRSKHPELSTFQMEFSAPSDPVFLADFKRGPSAALISKDLLGLGGRWIARVGGKEIASGATYCGGSSDQRRVVSTRFSDDAAFSGRMDSLSLKAGSAKTQGDERAYKAASREIRALALEAILAKGR